MRHIFVQKALEMLKSGRLKTDWPFCGFDESIENQFFFMYDVQKQVKNIQYFKIVGNSEMLTVCFYEGRKYYKINILSVVILFNLCLI